MKPAKLSFGEVVSAGSLGDSTDDAAGDKSPGAAGVLKAARLRAEQKVDSGFRKIKGLPTMDSPEQVARSSSNVADNERRLTDLFGEKSPGAPPGSPRSPASSKPYSPSCDARLQTRTSFGRPAVRFAGPPKASLDV